MAMEGDIERAVELLMPARQVVAFTGAGMSKGCGVETFRGKGGIWERFNAEDLATMEGFLRDPELVWRWNEKRRSHIQTIEPHPGYKAIVDLEGGVDEVVVVTQNIDGLHERSGSHRVIELHGNVWKVRCAAEENEPWVDLRVPLPEIPPRCECGGFLRPHVVWFGEPLERRVILEATAVSDSCNAMLVIGTSAVVYPAAGLPLVAKQGGAAIIEVNPEVTPVSEYADVSLYAPAEEVLPELVDLFLERKGIGAESAE